MSKSFSKCYWWLLTRACLVFEHFAFRSHEISNKNSNKNYNIISSNFHPLVDCVLFPSVSVWPLLSLSLSLKTNNTKKERKKRIATPTSNRKMTRNLCHVTSQPRHHRLFVLFSLLLFFSLLLSLLLFSSFFFLLCLFSSSLNHLKNSLVSSLYLVNYSEQVKHGNTVT